jgi:hypothetical protein
MESLRQERSIKVSLPLMYASLFDDAKYFCIFEEMTIEEDEIAASISWLNVKITLEKSGGRFVSLSSLKEVYGRHTSRKNPYYRQWCPLQIAQEKSGYSSSVFFRTSLSASYRSVQPQH